MPEKNDNSSSVRAVERALTILEILGKHDSLSLEEIHLTSGLAKSTASRLLYTLEEQGWVRRRMCDLRFHLSIKSLYGNPMLDMRLRLVQQAKPMLIDLSLKTGLVVDLSFFDGSDLIVIESIIPEVLRKRYPSRYLLGDRQASFLNSAMGKACLSDLSEAQIHRLGLRHSMPAQDLMDSQKQYRTLGYGKRTEDTWDYSTRLSFFIRAIALPVRSNGMVIGSIAFQWPKDHDTVENVQRLFLAELAKTVADVEAKFK